jgi:hypothetical protein
VIAVTVARAGGADPGRMSPAPRRRAAGPALPDLTSLAGRLGALGYSVAALETLRGGRALLVDRGGDARAAILPAALADRPGDPFEQLVRTLRELAPSRPLVPLALGEATDPAVRRRLRSAGIDLALREPLDVRVLRFQLNRALAAGPLPARIARRAPVEREVAVRRHLLSRSIPVYTLSSRGAFLLTDRPLAPGRRLWVEVPVGRLRARARARVVMANAADAAADRALPPGMAVTFETLDGPSAALLDRLVDERLAGLAL